jgi:Zn-finger nucleic acid-binding protein
VTGEARYPCPVCLGVKMEKLVLETAGEALVLDHCARCGGVWFEEGEVDALGRCEAGLLWGEISRRDSDHVMLCHNCAAPLGRNESRCGVCAWVVELDCPTCERPMDLSLQGGMRLDYCRACRGVWFDHAELTGIWRGEIEAALARRRGAGTMNAGGAAAEGSALLVDAMLIDPALYLGVQAGGRAAGAAAEGLARAGGAAAEGLGAAASLEVVGEVAGAASEAATGVFEVVLGIIGGIFS